MVAPAIEARCDGCLLDRGPSRCDPTCGQREVAGDVSQTDSEGNVWGPQLLGVSRRGSTRRAARHEL